MPTLKPNDRVLIPARPSGVADVEGLLAAPPSGLTRQLQ